MQDYLQLTHPRRPRGSKYGGKNPWVPTLTELFPKIQADTGSCLGTKNVLNHCDYDGWNAWNPPTPTESPHFH